MRTGAFGILALMLLVGFTGTASNGNEGADCDLERTFDLIAGQNIDVGEVHIEHTEDTMTIKYTTTGDWWLAETHVWIGTDVDGVPTSGKQNNPKIGQFPYSMEHDPMVQTYTYTFDLVEDLGWVFGGEPLVILTHAVVYRIVDGETVQGETGWAGDEDFPSQRWAYYFEYDPCNYKVLPDMPENDVTVRVLHDRSQWNAGTMNAYFHTTVTYDGADTPLPVGDDDYAYYLGWCANNNGAPYINSNRDYTATLYSSYAPPDGTDVGTPDLDTGYWDNINWILNNKDWTYDHDDDVSTPDVMVTKADVQQAIWGFTDDTSGGYTPVTVGGQALYDAAVVDGEGFFPRVGQNFAVIVWISSSVQMTIIEVDP